MTTDSIVDGFESRQQQQPTQLPLKFFFRTATRSCGNRGNSDAVVEWILAATIVQFAHGFIFRTPSIVSCATDWKASCFPTFFSLILNLLFGSSYVGVGFQHFCDNGVHLVHKKHIIRTCLMYHAACKVEFQPLIRSYSRLTFLKVEKMSFNHSIGRTHG